MLTTLAFSLLIASQSGFDAEKSSAAEVESLRKSMAALVGDCAGADFESAFDCQENQKSAAAALTKKKHYIYVGAVEGGLRFDGIRGDKARMIWTPIIDTKGGLALTVGRPSSLNQHGQAVVKNLVVDATAAPGIMAGDIERGIRVGTIAVEMVGHFGKPWTVTKGGKTVRGVEFKPTAIRFSNARNGKAIAEAKL